MMLFRSLARRFSDEAFLLEGKRDQQKQGGKHVHANPGHKANVINTRVFHNVIDSAERIQCQCQFHRFQDRFIHAEG